MNVWGRAVEALEKIADVAQMGEPGHLDPEESCSEVVRIARAVLAEMRECVVVA